MVTFHFFKRTAALPRTSMNLLKGYLHYLKMLAFTTFENNILIP